jgi:hypothetical protein
MASQSSNTYFAADTPERLVEYLSRKSQSWSTSITSNNYLDKMLDSWMWYHGFFYQDGHKVSFGGEQGEQVQLAINHYRNIAKHTLNMVTASRPAFQARSVNSDYKSQIQTELANGLLDYYMREKRLERYLKRAVEYAIVLGSGFIKIDWNATAGEIYDYIEPAVDEIDPVTGKKREPYPVYEGEAVFQNLSPLDVLFDNSKETYDDNIWVLVRTFKNKYDLIAKYPDLADKILSLKTKNDMSRRRVTFNPFDETTDVPVYEFYHKRTESVPNGRLVVYLEKDIVLTDTIMPYRALPIYRIAPGDILGTPFGYTDMWDLIPIQETINSLYSTVATNQNAFGVQNILNPRGNDIRVNQIEGGLNFIDYSPVPGSPSGGRPEALNLTQTPKEIFDFIGMLEKAQETVSGVNSVARGDAATGIKSGTALALIQSQSLQFMSGLQQSYIQLIEDVGTGLINILKDFASTPRIAAISGISNRVKIKEFTGEDLNSINRVIVDVGNALASTTAGKVQMAEQLLQMKIITTPEQYLQVMNTGNLQPMMESSDNKLTLIKRENEALLEGDIEVMAIATDDHAIHIREHAAILNDPIMRTTNPEVITRVLNHSQEHIKLLQETDPNLLGILGQTSLSPVGGTPNSPVQPPAPPAGAMNGMQEMSNPEAQELNPMDKARLPQPAKPAQSPDGNPVDPAQAMQIQQQGGQQQ